MIRLLIAEDHAIVRAGLCQILSHEPDIVVVGEVSDGDTLLDALNDHDIDALLLDLNMPGANGIDLVKLVGDSFPDLSMLVLSMHDEVQVVSRVLRAGASGYMTKDSDPALLVPAIRATASGRRYIAPELAQKMVLEGSTANGDLKLSDLTDREYQVLAAFVRGVRSVDLARELCLSPKTVSAHKKRLMRKLGVESTVQLVRYALDHQLLE